MTTFVTGELFVQVNYDTVLSLHSHALYGSLDFVTNEQCVCVCVCVGTCTCISQHWDHSCSNTPEGLDIFSFKSNIRLIY